MGGAADLLNGLKTAGETQTHRGLDCWWGGDHFSPGQELAGGSCSPYGLSSQCRPGRRELRKHLQERRV